MFKAREGVRSMPKKANKEFSTKLNDLVELVVDIRDTAHKQNKRYRQEITRLRNRIAVIEEKAA